MGNSEKCKCQRNDVLKVHEPLVRVLRPIDGDDKPTMAYIYEAMVRAKHAIKDNCRYYQIYWDVIDKRWNFQLHSDLHAASETKLCQEQLTDSFTPIDLENIIDDSDPINLWLSGKERPIFEEEDGTMNIKDDEDRQLGVSCPFRYSVDQQSEGIQNSGSGGDLSPPSSCDGSGDGGNGGN
ncbi:hypothetical protein Cgig2_031610 [Carnegiea gigantea]|uniref:Uncharacterized protein n=1 Tax=Carnegiea gigantea TaxID=171969 RepID=A0A9Q1K0N6_9CARY|nr:hypothetical protein Cgig2_031610 [Carnegiea gigantea]